MSTKFNYLDLMKIMFHSLYETIIKIDSTSKDDVDKSLIDKYNAEISALYNVHTKETISTNCYPSLLYHNISTFGTSFKKSFEYFSSRNIFMIKLKHSYYLKSIKLAELKNWCKVYGYGNEVNYKSNNAAEALIKYIYSNSNIITIASKLTKSVVNDYKYLRQKMIVSYDKKTTNIIFRSIGSDSSHFYVPSVTFSAIDNSKILVKCERSHSEITDILETLFLYMPVILKYTDLNSKKNKNYILELSNIPSDPLVKSEVAIKELSDELNLLAEEISSNNARIKHIKEDFQKRISSYERSNEEILNRINSIKSIIG